MSRALPVEPVVMYAYSFQIRRHTAYCRLCDWSVSDSSLRVVHAAGQDHTHTHQDGDVA